MSETNLTKQENPQDVLLVVIETGPQILMENMEQLEKTKTSVNKLLAEIKETGMSDELDAFCNKVQVRVKEVISEMNDRRKPLTTGMDKIRKSFTELEAEAQAAFDSVAKHRNAWATQKAEEQRKREEEAKIKLQKEQEKNRLIGEADLALRNGFLRQMTEYKQRLQDILNQVTLANFDSTWEDVNNWSSTYLKTDFDIIVIPLRGLYLQPEEVIDIKNNARAGKFEIWSAEFKSEVEGQKKEMLDKLPGIKRHLEERRQAEEKQRRDEEEARRKREEAAQIADAKKREEALAAAKKAEEDAERQRLENIRLDEERKKKEEEDRIRIEEENRKKEEENARKVAADTDVRNAASLFDNQLELSSQEKATVIESYEIEVKSPNGLLHIVSHYFSYLGSTEEVADLLKRSIGQMKTFCEKDYKKTGRKIDSPLIDYKPIYKVQARK